MMNLVPYFVARHNAIDLDRQGSRPGLFMRSLVLGPLAIIALGIAYLVLRVIGTLLFNIA